MPAVLARKCSNAKFGTFHCESFTNANKSYDVVLDQRGRNTCTCPAFAIKRNKLVKAFREHSPGDFYDPLDDPLCFCKHIDALKLSNDGCGWVQGDVESHEYEAICPKCFANTEVFDERDPETVDLDELMADYLALKDKLKKARA